MLSAHDLRTDILSQEIDLFIFDDISFILSYENHWHICNFFLLIIIPTWHHSILSLPFWLTHYHIFLIIEWRRRRRRDLIHQRKTILKYNRTNTTRSTNMFTSRQKIFFPAVCVPIYTQTRYIYINISICSHWIKIRWWSIRLANTHSMIFRYNGKEKIVLHDTAGVHTFSVKTFLFFFCCKPMTSFICPYMCELTFS